METVEQDSRIRNCYMRIAEGSPERQQLSVILAGLIWSESKASQILDKVSIVQYMGKKWFQTDREVAYKLRDEIVPHLTYKGIKIIDHLEILKDWTWADEDSE